MQTVYQHMAVDLLQTVNKPRDDVQDRIRRDPPDPKVYDRNESSKYQHVNGIFKKI